MRMKLAGVGAVVALAAVAIGAVAIAAGGGSVALPPKLLSANLVIEGIDGGDPGSPSIDVQSWSWGATQQGSFPSGGGSGAGKVDMHDLVITKPIDKASPKLALACATGVHIPVVTLTVLRPGKPQLPYMEYKLREVFITSVQQGGSGDEQPMEQVSFTFSRIDFKYTTLANVVNQGSFDTSHS
jgi:type VI secretion system secreted protein Hcp